MYKKFLTTVCLIATLLMLLSGCSSSMSLYDFKYDNKILSYNMSKSDIETKLGNGETTDSLYLNTVNYNQSINIAYSNNKARCIEITDPSVETYNNIKVKDNLSDVLKKYKCEQKSGQNYNVAFSKGREVNINEDNQIDFWIVYATDGSTISKITMYDSTFAKTMK